MLIPKPQFQRSQREKLPKKIKILLQQKFSECFGHKTIELLKAFHKKSAKTDFSKEMCVLISKELKHLNTVVSFSMKVTYDED